MLGVIYVVFILISFLVLLKNYYPSIVFKKPSLLKLKEQYHQFFNQILFKTNLEVETLTRIELPPYKMYPELINELLKLFLGYGFNLREQISALRSHFKKDIDQELKIKRTELSSALQFLAITFVTWIMIFLTSYQAEFNFTKKSLLLIVFWQLLGAGIFLTIRLKLKGKTFTFINRLIMTTCFWRVLLKSGIPTCDVFKKYPFDWQEKPPSVLKPLVKRLEEIIKLALQSGKPISEELNYLFAEIWYLYSDLSIQYERKLGKMRLIVLALFFLPSYFVFVYFMLDNLAFTI